MPYISRDSGFLVDIDSLVDRGIKQDSKGRQLMMTTSESGREVRVGLLTSYRIQVVELLLGNPGGHP